MIVYFFLGQLIAVSLKTPIIIGSYIILLVLLTINYRSKVWWFLLGIGIESFLINLIHYQNIIIPNTFMTWVWDPQKPVSIFAAGKFLESMILGTKRPDIPLNILREAGLSHVIAVSGLHTAIIVMIGMNIGKGLHWLLAHKFYIRKIPLENVGGLLSLLIYLFFVKISPSVERATIMAISYLLLRGRIARHGIHALCLAGSIILVIKPYQAYSISFQLSFLSTFGILITIEQVHGFIRKTLVTTSGAWIVTYPLALFVFKNVSPFGPLSNLILLPIFSLFVIPLAFLYNILKSLEFSTVPHIICKIVSIILNIIHELITLYPTDSLNGALPALLAISLMLLGKSKTKTHLFFSVIGIGIYALIIFIPHNTSKSFIFFSQNKGVSTVFIQNNLSVIIDAGAPLMIQNLKKLKIKKIKSIIITTCNKNNLKMIRKLITTFKTEKIFFKPYKECKKLRVKTYRGIPTNPLPSLYIKDIDNTPTDWLSNNDASTPLLITFNKKRILLTSNLGKSGWQRVKCVNTKVDLIVLPNKKENNFFNYKMFGCFNPQLGLILGGEPPPNLKKSFIFNKIPLFYLTDGYIVVRGAGLEPARLVGTGT